MRTTLDIDEDLLQAAKERARREHKTAGQVVSELLRQALTAHRTDAAAAVREPEGVYGFIPFPSRGDFVITNEMINRIRDEEGI
jgi:coenzyme F420-reducing hydrogenase beta subunit